MSDGADERADLEEENGHKEGPLAVEEGEDLSLRTEKKR